jgi:hypothetical protein
MLGGEKILFWEDNWVNHAPLSVQFPRLYQLSFQTLVEKNLPPAHQKRLPPTHFSAPATLMPAVIIIPGAFFCSSAVTYSTAGEYLKFAGDNIFHWRMI